MLYERVNKVSKSSDSSALRVRHTNFTGDSQTDVFIEFRGNESMLFLYQYLHVMPTFQDTECHKTCNAQFYSLLMRLDQMDHDRPRRCSLAESPQWDRL